MDNIPLFKVWMAEDAVEACSRTLRSGFVTQGPVVEEFEDRLRDILGSEYVLTLNSATSGLMLGTVLCNLQKNDTILACPLTCAATNWANYHSGCRIRWVDVDPATCNIDLSDLERKIDKTTRLVSFVHWAGVPVDLDILYGILDRKEAEFGTKIHVIQDCAHAFMSLYKGKPLCDDRSISVYSFQAIKHLTCGDGGAIVLPDRATYDRAKLLRWFGIDRDKRNFERKDMRLEHDIAEPGFKYHMNDISASIGLGNLESVLDVTVPAHRRNAAFLREKLRGVTSVRLLRADDCDPSYWVYPLLVKDAHGFIAHMKNRGITASQVHRRNDVHTCVAQFRERLVNLDMIEERYVCIPCGWWLQQSDLERIVAAVREYPEPYVGSSYDRRDVGYGELLKVLIASKKPKTIVEFGILDGYSLRAMASAAPEADIIAYDIFEDFDGSSAKRDVDVPDNVVVKYGNFFDVTPDKADVIHVDIANDASVFRFAVENYLSRLNESGVLILEGGSRERDRVPWMLKYGKEPIAPFLQGLDRTYYTVGTFPSLTVIPK